MNRATRSALLVLGTFGVLVATLAVFGLPIGRSLGLMFEGSLGDSFAWSRSLVKFIPLCLTGLGVAVAWKAGTYNIGGEGQFICGALLAAGLAKVFVTASWGVAGVIVLLAASVVGGGLWAAVAGWLHVKRGVEPVISTLLLNFVAVQLLEYAVAGPIQESAKQIPQTDPLPASLMLAKFSRQADLHYGIFIAVAAAIGVYVFLTRTKRGFQSTIVGKNPRVARANRWPADRIRFQSMALSGALCGLAGGVEYLGVTGYVGKGFPQQWGFLAIPVALLAGLHPLWILVSAFYIGALFAGTQNLASFTPAGTTLVYIIQGATVLGLLAIQFWSTRARKVVSE